MKQSILENNPKVLPKKPSKLDPIKEPIIKPKHWFLLLLLAFLVWAIKEYSQADRQKISQERKEKFLKDSARLENCVQYVLFADSSKFYPCYNGESDSIFLNKGEIWYYGETCYGENGRYGKDVLRKLFLKFEPQFSGNKQDAILEQKRKIYDYWDHPENQKRKYPLIRPAGNSVDN